MSMNAPVEKETLIQVEGVSKKFARRIKKALWYALGDIGRELTGRSVCKELRPDEFWALKDISFSVKRGEALGIIGANGAGKSTLLKVIAGIIKPTEGRAVTRGRILTLIELSGGMNPSLTGRENIYIRAALLGMSKKETDERYDDIVRFAEMEEFIEMPVQNYSSGMQVKLGFSIAVHMDPDVLIIDEVLAVGDQRFKAKARAAMSDLLEKDIALLFISHNMNQVISITERTIWLDRGAVFEEGKTTDVCTSYRQFQQAKDLKARFEIEAVKNSINTFSINDVKVADRLGNEVNLNSTMINGQSEDRVYEITLFFVCNENVKDFEVYHTLFVGSDAKERHSFIRIKDVITANKGETFQKTFTLDFSTLIPGFYQLGLIMQPRSGVSAVLFGSFGVWSFQIMPKQEKDGWIAGDIHYERMVKDKLGASELQARLIR